MKAIVTLLVVLICSMVLSAGTARAQELDIENLPAAVSGFVPQGYVPLQAVSGDLNLDRFKDVILVVKHPDESNQDPGLNYDQPKRPLLILIGQSDGSYKLAAQSQNAVYCFHCGGVFGDPFEGITIKRGFFSVEHYGGSNWRWTKVITFRYSPADKNWYLHRIGSISYHTSDPNKMKSRAKTVKNFGKVRFEKFDLYKDE
jgi:hypothetical protein